MKLAAIAKWTGRAAALLLLLFWGAFFVEHLAEWFMHRGGPYPPAWVWLAQVMHLAVLVGLGMMLRWDRLGTVVMVAATVVFFSMIGMHEFPYIALINLVPVAFFAVYWAASRTAQVR